MKKEKLLNIGGITLFYLVIIIGVLLLSHKPNYLDNTNINNYDNNVIAMND